MKKIKTRKDQTLFDIASQEYGNAEAWTILIEDNPHIVGLNDFPEGFQADDSCDFDLSYPLIPGLELSIREKDPLKKDSIIRKLGGKIIIS